MALTDTVVRNAKSTKSARQKYADDNGMYLLVTPTSKYWRLDYRYLEKRKRLALGVYPDVPLAKKRERCADARRLIADGIDPGQAKREERQDRIFVATKTFEPVARLCLENTAANRAPTTRVKVIGWLERTSSHILSRSGVDLKAPRCPSFAFSGWRHAACTNRRIA